MKTSLRATLLWGILSPVLLVMALSATSQYQQALQAADTAYDRTLLASAKAIGEVLELREGPQGPQVHSPLPYAALEAFEADNQTRLFYRVTGFRGEWVTGFQDLPAPQDLAPARTPYAALVEFYEDRYRGDAIRMAVLRQPVAGSNGQGMAVVQVAETLDLRHAMARQLLWSTLWRQALVLGVIIVAVVWVVRRATRPLAQLEAHWSNRDLNDLKTLQPDDTPQELQPLTEAVNQLMARLSDLLSQQKRFVRDAAHQLRTPLSVLKVQAQSGLRGDVPPDLALREIESTVDDAVELANQMLHLARAEQLRHRALPAEAMDASQVIRQLLLDLAPLMADREVVLNADIAPDLQVLGEPWALRELGRNLVHNAIKFSPSQGQLLVSLTAAAPQAAPAHVSLIVEDEGPGLPEELQPALFQPFARAASTSQGGAGLGLSIARELSLALQGQLQLLGRPDGRCGLRAVLTLPQAPRLAGSS